MAVLQSTFSETIPGGFPGMQADGELSNIISLILEGSTDCPFGTPVYRGTADRGVTLSVSASLRGIALATSGLPVTSDRPADNYAPGDTIPVIERGKVWVTSSTTAADGGQVYAVTASGLITSSSSSSTALAGWFFDETISAPGVVRIVRR